MRKALLAFLLIAVPLLVDPRAVTFDASKATLFAAGALVLAAMALPRRTGEGPGRLDLRWSPATVAIGAALLLFAASAVQGPDPWAAARLVALLLAAGVFALAVENAVFQAADLLPLLRAVAWAQGIVAAYGLLQAAGVDLPFSWNEGRGPVPASSLGNPNWAAEWCAAALPLALLAAARAQGNGRIGAALGLLLGAAFLVAARGRAAFLGIGVGAVAAAALWLAADRGPRRTAGIALGLALLAGVGAGGGWIAARGGDLPGWMGRSDTVVIRAELARGTARMLGDHPLGVGAGNWEAAHPPYRTEKEYRASLFRDPGEAHCDPLQLAAEGGWPFAAALAVLAYLLAAAALRGAGPGGDRGLAVALASSLAATAAVSLFSAPLHRPASLLLAALAAGGLAFLGGGRVVTLGTAGTWAHRGLVLLLVGTVIVLGQRMAAESPQSEGRRIERESDPLPLDRAVAARDLFARAAALDPGAADALARAGEVSLKIGAATPDREAAKAAFGDAVRSLTALRALRPSDPMVHSNLANALAAVSDGTEAERTWRRALEIAPWHRNANQALAYFLLRKGRAAEALPLVERALDVDPVYAPAVGTRAEALIAAGRDAEALSAASDGIDRLLAARDLGGAGEASRRAAVASPLLGAMLVGKGARLLAGTDREGGRAVVLAVAAVRPEEEVLEAAARGLAAGKYATEAARMRVEARFAAAEAALAAGDREKAAAEVRRGLAVTVSTEEMRRSRFAAASLFVRAGRREEALAALGVAASRGFADVGRIESDPVFDPLRDDPAFRGLLKQVRRNAEK